MIPWTAACQASLSFTISWNLLKLLYLESAIPSNHLILCYSLFLLPSIFPSIRVFSNELTLCIKWPKYWNFSFSTNPSNECSGLISFRIDRFISLLSKGLSRVFTNPTVQNTNSLALKGSLGGSEGKVSAYNVGDLASIPGSGRSLGEGNGNSLQYSCLENPMDRGAW